MRDESGNPSLGCSPHAPIGSFYPLHVGHEETKILRGAGTNQGLTAGHREPDTLKKSLQATSLGNETPTHLSSASMASSSSWDNFRRC